MGTEHEDHHGLSVSGPSSNEASYGTLVRQSSGVSATAVAVAAVTAADNVTPPNAVTAVASDVRLSSPDDRVEEQTVGEGGKGDDEVVAVVDGGIGGGAGGGGGEAGLTLSDEGGESEVDVLGVRQRSGFARL